MGLEFKPSADRLRWHRGDRAERSIKPQGGTIYCKFAVKPDADPLLGTATMQSPARPPRRGESNPEG